MCPLISRFCFFFFFVLYLNASSVSDSHWACVASLQLPEVVLIKDEDSDSNDTFEEGEWKPLVHMSSRPPVQLI